jgi:phosphoribosyl-AMP cyclohydrolase / phosphoribosyl-ATP pyrophosphohydrolase
MSEYAWIDTLQFDKETGLIPAIVQDVQSKEVLMLAYMNRESLIKTIETGTTWFWSRSRQEYWNKGATSGHIQKVVRISYDCDKDTLLVEVRQTGAACHTGKYSCFFTPAAGGERDIQESDRFAIMDELIQTIARRDAERPEGAYTTYLFEKGLDKILKKVGEESTEVIVAAKNHDAHELTCEVGDLIYHLLVLLRQQGLSFDEVLAELERRHGKQDMKGKTK